VPKRRQPRPVLTDPVGTAFRALVTHAAVDGPAGPTLVIGWN
jgi:hypothetical protein